METIYRLNTNDLDLKFIESLRKLFQNQEIFISVVPVNETQKMKSTIQYTDKILKAVRNIENGKTIDFTGEEFEQLTSKLIKQ